VGEERIGIRRFDDMGCALERGSHITVTTQIGRRRRPGELVRFLREKFAALG
jgi:hypothetical protein